MQNRLMTMLATTSAAMIALSVIGAGPAGAIPSDQAGDIGFAGVGQYGPGDVSSQVLTITLPAVSAARTGFIAEASLRFQNAGRMTGGYRVTYDANGVQTVRPYWDFNGAPGMGVLAPVSVQSGWKLKVGVFPHFESATSAPDSVQINWTRVPNGGREQSLGTKSFSLSGAGSVFGGKSYALWGVGLVTNATTGQPMKLPPATFNLTGLYATRSGLVNQPITKGGSSISYMMTVDSFYYGSTCAANHTFAVVPPNSVSSTPDDSTVTVKTCTSNINRSNIWEW